MISKQDLFLPSHPRHQHPPHVLMNQYWTSSSTWTCSFKSKVVYLVWQHYFDTKNIALMKCYVQRRCYSADNASTKIPLHCLGRSWVWEVALRSVGTSKTNVDTLWEGGTLVIFYTFYTHTVLFAAQTETALGSGSRGLCKQIRTSTTFSPSAKGIECSIGEKCSGMNQILLILIFLIQES